MGGKRTPQYNGGPKRPASHSTIRTKIGRLGVDHQLPDVYQLTAQLRDEHLTDMEHMRKTLHKDHLFEMDQMRKNLGDANLFEMDQARKTLRGELLAETDQLLNNTSRDKHHAEIYQLCQRLDEHRRDMDRIFPWKPHFW
jgi:hypothetical protein